MITFKHNSTRPISLDEKNKSEEKFINMLGEFKEEFEIKEGFVSVNHDKQKDNALYFQFDMSKGFTPEFIDRFNAAKLLP